MVETASVSEAFWVKLMHLGSVVPEVLREARWWFGASTVCPWGALGCIALLLAGWCFSLGFLLGALTFSSSCRRLLVQFARACLAGLETEQAPVVDLRQRLARYRQSGWCNHRVQPLTRLNPLRWGWLIWNLQSLLVLWALLNQLNLA